MQDRNLTRRIRRGSRALGFALFMLITAVGAQAQVVPVIREIKKAFIDDLNFLYYPFTYQVRGSSIWGPGVPGTQQVDFSLPLVSPTWNENLGVFFDPCDYIPFVPSCTFGAGLQAGISADTSAGFHARADLGSVDLNCPGGVGIHYPNQSELQPGKPFTIQTYCLVGQTAYMNINAPHLGLTIDGMIESQLDLALIAEAFGHKFVDINIFSLLGLPSPSISGDQELLDTGNLLPIGTDYPLPIPPNIGTGYFHVPNLSARGILSGSQIKAHAADNFLTFNADLTNLLLQYAAFGIPIPLNGDYDFGGFELHFHLLDLQLQATAGVEQDFNFDPRPLVQFKTLGGTIKTVRAGDSVTFIAPISGSFSVTPTIFYDQNSFSDATAVTVDPSLSFDLIKIKGGGRVAGHDLFSFDLDPFGTQTVEDAFALPLFDQSFALPAPSSFTCPPFHLYGTGITQLEAGHFVALSRTLTDSNNSATITGTLSTAILPGAITLHVQGEQGAIDQVVDVSDSGYFSAFLSNVSSLGRYRPLAISGTYKLPNDPNHTDFPINPATVYWPRPALHAGAFGSIAYDPNKAPNGNLVTYRGTGKFTLPLHSFNVEPDATLLYDDIPLPTSIGSVAEIGDGYQVTGEIPDFLLNRGGVHTLSFLNSGINQKPALVQTVEVKNAVPTLTDVLKKRSMTDNSPLLLVRGTGFTLDTSVKIGGQLRSVLLIAPTELRVPLLTPDCVAGIHPVVVSNPAPGGGSISASYKVAPVPADIPSLIAKHSLLRHAASMTNDPHGDTVADLITLTNVGQNVLNDVTVTSVNLLINGKTFAGGGTPLRFPLLRPGNYSSVQVILPSHSSVAGDIGILQVRGAVHGKAFVLSNRVVMPAFDL